MVYVGFDDKGYDLFDEGNYVLFTSNNSHADLFDYITKDLSALSKLIEQHISKRMDIETFELKDCQDDEELVQIIKILQSTHPYFKCEKICRDTIIYEIGNYFNDLLIYNHTQHTLNYDITEDWHVERIRQLTLSPLLKSEIDENTFYKNYQNHMGKTDGEAKRINMDPAEETFFIGKPKPIGFNYEICTQKIISNMLYFILDILAPNMNKLSIPQRIWLYGNIFQDQSTIEVSKQLLFYPPTLFGKYRGYSEEEYSKKIEYNGEMYKLFEPFRSSFGLNAERDGIPKSWVEPLKSAIQYAKETTTKKFYEQYEVRSLRELLYLEIILMIQDGTMIRKCNNCGKYFVVKNRKIAYCDREDESGNLCSAVGSKQTFQKKMENEEELKIYNRAYKTRHARFRNGKITIHDLDKWREEAKEKLEKVRAGEMEISDFQEWLKK